MSTTASARNMAADSKQPSSASGTKSRVPSSRLGARERPLSSQEVIPEDSASNGPYKKSASGARKTNGSTTILGERQTGRVHLATRENLQVRTKSPVKVAVSDGIEDRGSKERVTTRLSNRTLDGQAQPPSKEKKALCGSFLEYVLRINKLILWNSSIMETSSFSHCTHHSAPGCSHLRVSLIVSYARISRARIIDESDA